MLWEQLQLNNLALAAIVDWEQWTHHGPLRALLLVVDDLAQEMFLIAAKVLELALVGDLIN